MSACDRCLALSELTVALAAVARLADAVAGASPVTLADAIPGLASDRRTAIRARWGGWRAEEVRRAGQEAGLVGRCRCDDRYPAALRELPDPPPVLWIRGDESVLAAGHESAVGLVGTRRPTLTGREAARRIGAGVGRAGGLVVSGMALGIDAAGHEGALSVGAPTIAVLAGGADRPSPPSNRRLYERILERGAIVAELPPGLRPLRWAFPARNRLIAALSAATLVVEAPLRSGALITVTHATDLGRPVFAVPGSLASDSSEGSNRLLVDGAGAVTEAADLAAVLGLTSPSSPQAQADGPGAVVIEALRRRPLSVHELERAATSLGPGEVEVVLLDLELAGWVQRRPDGRYAVAMERAA